MFSATPLSPGRLRRLHGAVQTQEGRRQAKESAAHRAAQTANLEQALFRQTSEIRQALLTFSILTKQRMRPSSSSVSPVITLLVTACITNRVKKRMFLHS